MNNQKNINYLPNDLMSLILNMRTEEMKKDKQIKESKEKYNNVVSTFKESIYSWKDDILRDRIGTRELYKEILDESGDYTCEDSKKVLDTWEIWEIYDNLLTPIEEEWEDEERCNTLNWYIEDIIS